MSAGHIDGSGISDFDSGQGGFFPISVSTAVNNEAVLGELANGGFFDTTEERPKS